MFLDTNLDEVPSSQIIATDGAIDPRLKLLSYSSILTLHECPRKYQLYKLNYEGAAEDQSSSVTFAYGHAVGAGIQAYLQDLSEDQVLFQTFLAWSTDLLDSSPKQSKSIWEAIFAVQQLAESNLLADYELVYLDNKPAVELSFLINMPEGFIYRGHIDAVIRHKESGEILVLECKTTSGTTNEATYKNSSQALSYSVVLDKLFPDLASYSVLYLVYETKTSSYQTLEFQKSLLHKALFLQNTLVECEIISMYHAYDTFPQHGQSCFSFYRPCTYLGLCHMQTEHMGKPLTQGILDSIEEDKSKYQIHLDFYELVQSQIEKSEEA